MADLDFRIRDYLHLQTNLVTRAQVLSVGGTDRTIDTRVHSGRWTVVHAGVYQVGAAPLLVLHRLLAACLASGETAAISHRAAAALWDLDGFHEGLLEMTVPHATEAVPCGVIVHRSRRIDPSEYAIRRGVPVFVIERVLAEIGRFVPLAIVEKATEDALRRRLTTETRLWAFLENGGIHLLGARKLRRALLLRTPGRPAGSPAEVDFVRCVRRLHRPAPIRQHLIRLPDGSAATVDFAWPAHKLVVEIDGRLGHDGRRARRSDQARDEGLMRLGWRVHRVPARRLHCDPASVATEIETLLGGKTGA